jgi:TPR repeat protein
MYVYGWGVPIDQTKGISLLSQAAQQNDAEAENDLGDYYLGTSGYTQAVPWFNEAAQQGVANAEAMAGEAYVFGDGVARDEARGVALLQKGAAQNDLDAVNDLGLAYKYGLGVSVDYGRAVSLFRQAALAGNPHAASNLGSMYQFGQGVPLDYSQAIYWFKMSDTPNCSCGDNSLGYMYANGIGVPHDDAQAFSWYMNSAKKRRSRRCGETKDFPRAARYYEASAAQGDAEALVNLGYQYETGEGVPQSYETEFELALITKSLIKGPSIMREKATGWLQQHGGIYDPSLNALNAPRRWTLWYIGFALAAILLIYGMAKIIQRGVR